MSNNEPPGAVPAGRFSARNSPRLTSAHGLAAPLRSFSNVSALGGTVTWVAATRTPATGETISGFRASERECGNKGRLIKLLPGCMRRDVEQQCRQRKPDDKAVQFGSGTWAEHAAAATGEPSENEAEHGEQNLKLAIGFTMCAAFSVVPGYARRFGTVYPEVVLNLREVVSNDLAAQVLAGQIDAAIMFPGPPNKSLAMRTILSEPLCVALSRTHPRARARQLRIAQLAQEPFVMALEEVAPTLRATILTHCRSGGFEPNIRFEVQLQQTVLSLVDEGAGIALVPTSMRKAQLAGVVFRRLVDAPLIEQVLVWSPANRNPCLARFLDLTQAG